MANRYWVGGTADWDGTAGTKWAATSGGTGGEAVPTASDDVFFDANSGAVTVNINAIGFAKSVTCTGFTGTLTGGSSLLVYGSFILAAGMTYSFSGTLELKGTGSLNTASKNIAHSIIISAAGATVSLASNLTMTSSVTLNLLAGTFDAAGYNVSLTPANFSSSGTSVRTLALGSGTWTTSGTNWTCNPTTNLTVTGSAIINKTGASSFQFTSVSIYWPGLDVGGSGAVILAESCYFGTLSNSVSPATIRLQSGKTQSVDYFNVSGTPGNLVTFNSLVNGSQGTISKVSGVTTASYMGIKDINATGGTWNALNSTNFGNSTGWFFSGGANMLAFFS